MHSSHHIKRAHITHPNRQSHINQYHQVNGSHAHEYSWEWSGIKDYMNLRHSLHVKQNDQVKNPNKGGKQLNALYMYITLIIIIIFFLPISCDCVAWEQLLTDHVCVDEAPPIITDGAPGLVPFPHFDSSGIRPVATAQSHRQLRWCGRGHVSADDAHILRVVAVVHAPTRKGTVWNWIFVSLTVYVVHPNITRPYGKKNNLKLKKNIEKISSLFEFEKKLCSLPPSLFSLPSPNRGAWPGSITMASVAYMYPSCLQMTLADLMFQPSSHIVPHESPKKISTRPSSGRLPPLNRTLRASEPSEGKKFFYQFLDLC